MTFCLIDPIKPVKGGGSGFSAPILGHWLPAPRNIRSSMRPNVPLYFMPLQLYDNILLTVQRQITILIIQNAFIKNVDY